MGRGGMGWVTVCRALIGHGGWEPFGSVRRARVPMHAAGGYLGTSLLSRSCAQRVEPRGHAKEPSRGLLLFAAGRPWGRREGARGRERRGLAPGRRGRACQHPRGTFTAWPSRSR